ncbi:MAG: ABC transporter permease [Patescibacteria group bacterium]|jgi:ABC-2 type transport system permease protein
MNWVGLATLYWREIRRTFQVSMQTIFPPIITSLLYILIFGNVLGSRIQEILPGVSYIDFMIPGLLMMNVISASFSSSSAVIYIGKLQNTTSELLVAPLSYLEIVLGFVLAATTRGLIVGMGVYGVALFFTTATFAHFWMFLYFVLATSLLFGAVGAMVGLWAETFDHVNLPNTFVLLPLSFFGGVFHSIRLLPSWMQTLSQANPVFYMVNGIRASMIGTADVPMYVSAIVVLLLAAVSLTFCVRLFQKGYNLRS